MIRKLSISLLIGLFLPISSMAGAGDDSVQNLKPEDRKKIENVLSNISQELNKFLIFENFPIKAKSCGIGSAFSSEVGITVCMEVIPKIFNVVRDREKLSDVLLFMIFHESAHLLLRQWGHPFYDNEEIADDFATALLVILGQKERLSAITEYFISNPMETEVLVKTLKGDKHPISLQRSRNIYSWLREPERYLRWFAFFIPYMQSNALLKLKDSTTSQGLLEKLKTEIENRGLTEEEDHAK